jgi:hypothetical protein
MMTFLEHPTPLALSPLFGLSLSCFGRLHWTVQRARKETEEVPIIKETKQGKEDLVYIYL